MDDSVTTDTKSQSSDVRGKIRGVVKTVFLEAKSPLFVREDVKTIFVIIFCP